MASHESIRGITSPPEIGITEHDLKHEALEVPAIHWAVKKHTDLDLSELDSDERPKTTFATKKPTSNAFVRSSGGQNNGGQTSKADGVVLTRAMYTRNAHRLKSSSLSNATTVLQVVGYGQVVKKKQAAYSSLIAIKGLDGFARAEALKREYEL